VTTVMTRPAPRKFLSVTNVHGPFSLDVLGRDRSAQRFAPISAAIATPKEEMSDERCAGQDQQDQDKHAVCGPRPRRLRCMIAPFTVVAPFTGAARASHSQ
jgi:hypothetical protein